MLSSATYILNIVFFDIHRGAHSCYSFTFTTLQYFMNIFPFTFSFSLPWILFCCCFAIIQKCCYEDSCTKIHIYMFKSFSRTVVLKVWSYTNSIGFIWDLVSSANIWTPPQTYQIRNSGDGDSNHSRRFWCRVQFENHLRKTES